MKVLIAHVSYRETGGEDQVVAAEAALLREHGVDVVVHNPNSAEFDAFPPLQKVRLGMRLADHSYGRHLVRELVLSENPDVVHFHNIYPLYGPGGMHEAARLGRGVVQTIHNYRLSCLNGRHFLFDSAQLCERCRPLHFGPGVVRGCYRDSRSQSILMARALSAQWRLLHRGVPHLLLAVSEFVRDRLVAAGAPPERIVVKPNSVAAGRNAIAEREGVVFVGRLSREKGVLDLVQAWPEQAPRLTVVGDGPLMKDLQAAAGPSVRLVGKLSPDLVRKELTSARVCVLPSVWFECLPLVMLEALAEGTPVVGFRETAVGPVVTEVASDLAVEFGDMRMIAERASAVAADAQWPTLSARCRDVYRRQYTDTANATGLLDAYRRVVEGVRPAR